MFVLIAYAGTIHSSFHFDDYSMFVDPYITHPGFGWQIFRLAQTRPLTFLTFHWNYLASGQDPAGYHWVNILLHIANSILVLSVARRYIAIWVAFGVALVFALHPLQTEAVTYIFNRATLLSTFFALWTIWFYLRGRWRLSALMFALAMLAKEEAIALPAFLLLLDLYEKRRPRVTYYILLGVISLGAALRLFYAIGHSAIEPGVGRVAGIGPIDYLLSESRVIWVYLRLFFVPVGLNLDHDIPLSTSLVSPWTTLSALIGLFVAAGTLYWLTRKRKMAALWALGFFVLIAPSSSFIPQADLAFEHRTYFPLVCLVVALGMLASALSRRAIAIACIALVPAMMTATIYRNKVWLDDKSLWSDVLDKSPRKPRAYLGMARAWAAEDPARSLGLLQRGLALAPSNVELHVNFGVALLNAKKPGEALLQFRRALALSRESADLWNNIGAAYYNLGDLSNARTSYRRALQLDACNYSARRNLVMLLSQFGSVTEAYNTGAVPATCHLVPEQAADLEQFRQQIVRVPVTNE